MIGNGHVGVAAVTARLDHLGNRVLPVGVRRVHLKVALNVANLDEARQRSILRRFDLPAVFPQLRRDPGQTDGLEDVCLGPAAYAQDVLFECGADAAELAQPPRLRGLFQLRERLDADVS